MLRPGARRQEAPGEGIRDWVEADRMVTKDGGWGGPYSNRHAEDSPERPSGSLHCEAPSGITFSTSSRSYRGRSEGTCPFLICTMGD